MQAKPTPGCMDSQHSGLRLWPGLPLLAALLLAALLLAAMLLAAMLLGSLLTGRVQGAAPAGCTELLVNGDFEAGQTGWTEQSAAGYELISRFNPHTGAWGAYLAGSNAAADQLSQQIVLPAGAASITLQAWWAVATEETSGAFDTLTISLMKPNGAPLVDLVEIDNSADPNIWSEAVADLSAYAGQTVILRITAITDASNPTDFYVDDVSVAACAASDTPTVTPTSTHTPLAPTATPSATNTVPAGTATPTTTSTPLAPSATPSATHTPRAPGEGASYMPLISVRGA